MGLQYVVGFCMNSFSDATTGRASVESAVSALAPVKQRPAKRNDKQIDTNFFFRRFSFLVVILLR